MFPSQLFFSEAGSITSAVQTAVAEQGVFLGRLIPNGNVLLMKNPAPVDRWFIPLFIGFQHVSTILLVAQAFATIHSRFYFKILVEGSLAVKLPTIWTDEKQSRAEAERRERLEERRVEEKE